MMKRKEYDYYPTPNWCFEELPLDWKRFTGAHEPCGGDGRIISFLQSNEIPTTYSEIREGNNFLDWEGYTDLILTNPPFNQTIEFLHHSLTRANTVIMLLPLRFLASIGRKQFHQINTPTGLIILSRRPCFVEGRSDNTDYAWHIWDKTDRTPENLNWL